MKTPKELVHIVKHLNDFTYRFNPKTGNFRWREFRGPKDDLYTFRMWLIVWKDMVRFVLRDPIGVAKALFRYPWFASYLNYPAFVDRGTLGMRGTQLRMARLQYDRIVKKATGMLHDTFAADKNLHPRTKKALHLIEV